MIDPMFSTRNLNQRGLERLVKIREDYTALLRALDCVPGGRERSLAITALQESCMWMVRAMALQPENHVGANQ